MLGVLATVCTFGLTVTSLSIFARAVYFTSYFLTKLSWVKPSLLRTFLIFSPIIAIVLMKKRLANTRGKRANGFIS